MASSIAAPPAPLVSARASDFRRQVQNYTKTLLESMGALIREAKVPTQQAAQSPFQINVATAEIITSAEGLLRLIRELKLSILLQDFEAMDAEVDAAN
ncbi:unnamed protein product, partial [Phaeothamnion confervicola]